ASTTTLAVALAVVAVPAAQAQDGVELIFNGDFEAGTAGWFSYGTSAPPEVVDGQFCADIPGGTENPWDIGLGQNDLPLASGEAYALTFTATATAPITIRSNLQLNEEPFTTVISMDVDLTAEPQTFTASGTSTVDSTNGQVAFQVGGNADDATICLDNVSLIGAPASGDTDELLHNGSFDEGVSPWWSYGTDSLGVVSGALCADMPGGTENPWDAGIGQNGVPFFAGAAYTLTFTAWSDVPVTIRAAVQLNEEPFTAVAVQDVDLTAEPQTFTVLGTSPVESTNGQVAFQTGGNAADAPICLSDVSLSGPPPRGTAQRGTVHRGGGAGRGPHRGAADLHGPRHLPGGEHQQAGRVPDRRQRRRRHHLPGRRLADRPAGPAVRAGHRAAGAGEP